MTRVAAAALLLVAGLALGDAAIDDLDWLSGCWKHEAAEPGSGEQWMYPAGGTMLGMSRTIERGKTLEHEFMQVSTRPDGTIAFIAQPWSQHMTTFPLLSITTSEVVFENLQHDFPQRVAYRLEGRSRLVARIEGIKSGTLRVVEFPMARVSCEAPAVQSAR